MSEETFSARSCPPDELSVCLPGRWSSADLGFLRSRCSRSVHARQSLTLYRHPVLSRMRSAYVAINLPPKLVGMASWSLVMWVSSGQAVGQIVMLFGSIPEMEIWCLFSTFSHTSRAWKVKNTEYTRAPVRHWCHVVAFIETVQWIEL